jgi:hypothetical protein
MIELIVSVRGSAVAVKLSPTSWSDPCPAIVVIDWTENLVGEQEVGSTEWNILVKQSIPFTSNTIHIKPILNKSTRRHVTIHCTSIRQILPFKPTVPPCHGKAKAL